MRSATAGLLVLVATLLTPLGVTAWWLGSTVDDTDAYVDTVAPLADDPELRDRLAEAVGDAVSSSLDEDLPLGLPAGFDGMIDEAARQVTANEEFPRFWRDANRATHREFLAIVEDDAPADGWLLVDLGPLMLAVYAELEADGVPVAMLPDPRLVVPVAPESELAEHRDAYQLLDAVSGWLPVLWAALVLLAAAVARGLRGRLVTLGLAALGLALGAVLVRLAAGPVSDVALESVDPGRRGLADLIAEVMVDRLESTSVLVAAVAAVAGLVLVIGAALAGRRRAAPYPAAY
ncbi:hypothetical protein HNR19_003815 [Nocardioides thalensis]|uniref:Integral membrane protein n=1 Tax=Nocardioides thalensis TaxID=1914755 RepID=A0A853C742_9ACTN|nr:hypothetical protein [Nocardioides thalensis]NYJ03117.1 hypothetical protein [Nocardioides thalensis]